MAGYESPGEDERDPPGSKDRQHPEAVRVAFDDSDRAYLAVAAAWRGAGVRGATLDIEPVVPASTDWFLALGHSAAEFAGVALLDIYLDLEQKAEEFARELVAESPLTWRIVRPSVSMVS